MERWLLLGLLTTLAACSAVLDSDDHRGGSGGGGDGGVDETCNGSGDVLPEYFAGHEHGKLPVTPLLTDAEGYLPELAMTATPFGGSGFGTALVFAMEGDGDVHRPVRFDVPLGDVGGGSRELLRDSLSMEDLSATATATSVDANGPSGDTGNEISVVFVDATTSEARAGIVDLATTTPDFGYSDFGDPLDEPGVLPHVEILREAGTPPTLSSGHYMISGVAFNVADSGVPGGEFVRLVTTSSDFIMLQDESETFWFWGADPSSGTAAVTEQGHTGQSGKAAWTQVSGDVHLLVYRRGSDFVFRPYACATDTEDNCEPQPLLQSPASVPAGPAGGQVPAAHSLPDGRAVAVLVSRHNDGDVLDLQILDSSLLDVTTPRVPLLDLRGTGERVTDARLDLAEAAEATTLAVTAAVRDGDAGDADRIVLTGVQTCPDE